MRLLTKAEACRELMVSLSTLNRRIAAGDVPVKREPRGGRHRVYVMLDGDPPGNGVAADPALAMARERIRGLEVQVELLQGQLETEGARNAGLVDAVEVQMHPCEKHRPWWRLW